MTAFRLKIIAIISMFLDHFGYFLSKGAFTTYNFFGRLAFPIFAFQISEGYKYTKSLNKYLSRLFIFALISQIPFMFFVFGVYYRLPIDQFVPNLQNYFSLNIFFTLFLGLLSIIAYDKSKNKLIGFIAVALLCALGQLLKVDYGYWGVLLIFVFYFFKDNKILTAVVFFSMCILKYIPNLIQNQFNINVLIACLSTFSAIIPILLYNGKLGPKTKRLLYVFYPAHLILLYFATLI